MLYALNHNFEHAWQYPAVPIVLILLLAVWLFLVFRAGRRR